MTTKKRGLSLSSNFNFTAKPTITKISTTHDEHGKASVTYTVRSDSNSNDIKLSYQPHYGLFCLPNNISSSHCRDLLSRLITITNTYEPENYISLFKDYGFWIDIDSEQFTHFSEEDCFLCGTLLSKLATAMSLCYSEERELDYSYLLWLFLRIIEHNGIQFSCSRSVYDYNDFTKSIQTSTVRIIEPLPITQYCSVNNFQKYVSKIKGFIENGLMFTMDNPYIYDCFTKKQILINFNDLYNSSHAEFPTPLEVLCVLYYTNPFEDSPLSKRIVDFLFNFALEFPDELQYLGQLKSYSKYPFSLGINYKVQLKSLLKELCSYYISAGIRNIHLKYDTNTPSTISFEVHNLLEACFLDLYLTDYSKDVYVQCDFKKCGRHFIKSRHSSQLSCCQKHADSKRQARAYQKRFASDFL